MESEGVMSETKTWSWEKDGASVSPDGWLARRDAGGRLTEIPGSKADAYVYCYQLPGVNLAAYLNRLEALAALGAEEVDLSRLHPWDFEAKYGRKPDLRDLRDRYDAIARPARAEEV